MAVTPVTVEGLSIPVDEDHRTELDAAIARVQGPRVRQRCLGAASLIRAARIVEDAMAMTHAETDRVGAAIRVSGGKAPAPASYASTVCHLTRNSRGWRLTSVSRRIACPDAVTLPDPTPGRQMRWLSQAI